MRCAISRPLLLLIAGLFGCANWPVADHLAEDGAPYSTDTDPAALVEVTWGALLENVDFANLPSQAEQLVGPNALGEGLLIDGTLVGSGWQDNLQWSTWEDPRCPGAQLPEEYLSALDGYFAADEDLWIWSAPGDGALCVSVSLAQDDAGADFLIHRLGEACAMPHALVWEGDQPLGRDAQLRAPQAIPVIEGDRFLIQLGAYAPQSAPEPVNYRAGISFLLSSATSNAVWCPLLPEEPL